MLISYAQNFEDVMLWRALSHISCGTYIDVGANDPTNDSVTRLFYENGWRGINIEPIDQWYSKLIRERNEDINLNIAISSIPGNIVIYEIPNTGLSTSVEKYRDKHERLHGYKAVETLVPTKSLDQVIQENSLSTVHFLKIDVEGAENSVLESINLTGVRPWIILVEATEPNSQVSKHSDWEHILFNAKYAFAYCDGLNRFYVASEHSKLLESMNYPPNVFDNYVRYSEAKLQNQLEELSRQLSAAQFESNSLKMELVGMRKSLSWRITRPLRIVKKALLG